jgi:cytochrome c oxidase subunit 2
VVVDDEQKYRTWLAAQPTFSESSALAAGDPAAGEAAFAPCAACHGAKGEGNQAQNAPKIAGQPGWYIARQLKNFKEGVRGAHKDDVNGKTMAAMAAMLDEQGVRNVGAYLATLPDQPAKTTISGNISSGESHYTTCAACHGRGGEGVWSTNAPRLSHMSDWYMATQLSNFSKGIRGSHPLDFPGAQMGMMARSADSAHITNDLLAYINSMK